jgi:hypothetical protein
VSDPLIFSQSSIFYLQKIAHNVHSSTGVRHKLSDQNSMLKLLKTATLSSNSVVQEDLEMFARDLNSQQVSELMGRGVILKNRRA